MANIITKSLGSTAKNNVLTNAELDNNFINLNEELITKINYDAVEYPSLTEQLHRSPNTISSMFIYDTSKDSDGGAWTDKCQNTSWYNETINGNWLGARFSESDARCYNAILGPELAINGSFTTDTNWTKGTNVTINNGTAIFTGVADNIGLTAAIAPLIANNYYTITFTINSYSSGSVEILLGTTSILYPNITNGTYTVSGLANGTAFVIRANGTSTYNIDNVSLKLVNTQINVPNDYFQLISDGKFYSLSKNFLTTTATLATQTQFLNAGTYTISSTTASSGSVAISGAATATHIAGTPTTFTVTTSGAVTFTVTGSVLTAQVELGISATTYSANTSTTRYTETFRGNKKEFPKISAIVGEPNTIIIYDLTEKNNPMWMRFPLSITKPLYGETVSSIDALNSNIAIGSSNATNGALSIVSFISDSIKMYTTTVNKIDQNIAQRNNTVSFTIINSTGLVSRVVNDVSMAILPNAPIDAGTGLKIPTVAVATINGVNVITNRGVILTGALAQAITRVILHPNRLYFTRGASATSFYYVNNPANLTNSFVESAISGIELTDDTIKEYSIINNKMVRVNNISRDIQLALLNNKSLLKSCFANIGKTYNTGYEIGDIRRTYLSSSIQDTISLGTELVANGTFDGATPNTDGWSSASLYPSTIAIVNNQLEVTSIGQYGRATYPVSTVIGKSYILTIGTNVAAPGSTLISAYISNSPTGSGSNNMVTSANYSFEAAQTTYWVTVGSGSGVAGNKTYHDNISVKECESDKSYKGKYADIYGTLTKSAVNTGSDLVQYSGFSNTNYLQELHSNDLDFGLLEFNISSWVNIPINNTNVGTICSRAYPSGPTIVVSNNSSNNLVATLYDGTTTRTVTTSAAYNTGTPIKVSASYKYGKLGISVNGKEVATNLGLPLKALSGAWVEVAPQLAGQIHILSSAVYNGKLYGGTYPNGKLFEWNGTNAWVEVANTLNAETHILSLAVYNGKLYGGTYPNGKLFEWNGTNAWVEVANTLNAETHILSLAVYNGKLYGGTYPNGKLFEWNGTNAWVEVAPQLASQTYIYSLAVYNNGSGDKLYGGTSPNGKLFEWNGTNAWVEVAPQLASETYIYSLAVYNGGSGDKLYGGTSNGKLLEWNGSNAWIEVAPQLASQTSIYSLAVYNGGSGDKLYGGTHPDGKLFEWNGSNAWIEVAPQLASQTHISSLTVFNGGSGDKLYGGTASNGKLFEWNGYGTNSTLTIGNNADLTAPFPGSLSLLKLSGTVPTKEQELFMYEQEKQLCNPNTKCVLPDDDIKQDISIDEYSNTLSIASTTNLCEWNGLVRTNNIPVPFGLYTKIDSAANITIAARSTSNHGVDILSPKYNIKKKIAEKDSYSKSKTYPIEIVDYIAGFTGTTVLNSNVITSNDIPSYDIIDTIITGTNIPANTTILAISGTSIYISNLATGAGSVNISFLEYKLPIGYTTKYMVKNGVYLTEGATKDYYRVSDEFREIIKLVATPNYQDWIQLQITKG